MNLEECYTQLGGNYQEVSQRLPNPGMIERFIGRFLEDKSFETLCQQLACGNRAEAFRAAHTLKGVCANLGFSRLFDSAARLTEALRTETSVITDEAIELFKDVRRDYETTAEAIRRYLDR